MEKSEVSINGLSYPSEFLETNYTPGSVQAMVAYRWFLDNIGITNTDTHIGISPEEFNKNCFMLPFDLTPRGVSLYLRKIPYKIIFKFIKIG